MYVCIVYLPPTCNTTVKMVILPNGYFITRYIIICIVFQFFVSFRLSCGGDRTPAISHGCLSSCPCLCVLVNFLGLYTRLYYTLLLLYYTHYNNIAVCFLVVASVAPSPHGQLLSLLLLLYDHNYTPISTIMNIIDAMSMRARRRRR